MPEEKPLPQAHGRQPVGVRLTPTEARLLDVLRKHPGRTFTRLELLALVMPGTVVLERTVDVHIKGLRQKLGSLSGMIQTVRGVGYQWAPPG